MYVTITLVNSIMVGMKKLMLVRSAEPVNIVRRMDQALAINTLVTQNTAITRLLFSASLAQPIACIVL